jgi:hypothetical protein
MPCIVGVLRIRGSRHWFCVALPGICSICCVEPGVRSTELWVASFELFRIQEGEDGSDHGASKAGTTDGRDFALCCARRVTLVEKNTE